MAESALDSVGSPGRPRFIIKDEWYGRPTLYWNGTLFTPDSREALVFTDFVGGKGRGVAAQERLRLGLVQRFLRQKYELNLSGFSTSTGIEAGSDFQNETNQREQSRMTTAHIWLSRERSSPEFER